MDAEFLIDLTSVPRKWPLCKPMHDFVGSDIIYYEENCHFQIQGHLGLNYYAVFGFTIIVLFQ